MARRILMLGLGLALLVVALVTVGRSGPAPVAQADDGIDANALIECLNGLSTDLPGNRLKCTLVVTDPNATMPGIDLFNLQECLNAISGLAPGSILRCTDVVTDPEAAVDSVDGAALQECLGRFSNLGRGHHRPVGWEHALCNRPLMSLFEWQRLPPGQD